MAMTLDGEKCVEWVAAMEAELESLLENEVYEEVPRPSGKVIGTKWVMRVKTNAAGNLDKFKATVVAKGFRRDLTTRRHLPPTVRFESVRALVALAAGIGWHLD